MICNFYLSVTARTTQQIRPRDPLHDAGTLNNQQQTTTAPSPRGRLTTKPLRRAPLLRPSTCISVVNVPRIQTKTARDKTKRNEKQTKDAKSDKQNKRRQHPDKSDPRRARQRITAAIKPLANLSVTGVPISQSPRVPISQSPRVPIS